MVSGKSIAGLLVAVTIAATLFMPINSAITSNSGDITVTDEEVTADIGNETQLDGYSIEDGSETVEWYNETSSSWETVSSGTDYSMDYEQGTITALSGGTINDGDDLRVDYTYAATDGTTSTVMGLIPMFLGLLMLVSLAKPVMESL